MPSVLSRCSPILQPPAACITIRYPLKHKSVPHPDYAGTKVCGSSANCQKLPKMPFLMHSFRQCPALQRWGYTRVHGRKLRGSICTHAFGSEACPLRFKRAQYLQSRSRASALPPCQGKLTLSPELSRDEIRILIHAARLRGPATRFALIVQGTSEAMISEDCLLQPWLAMHRHRA